MNLSRYAHTIRHLRPVQIYGRAWFRIHRPRADTRPAPPVASRTSSWHAWTWRTCSLHGGNTFTFLNVEGAVATAVDWDDPSRSKLWRYNLHYFDDLVSTGCDARVGAHRALIARWIRENPPAAGTGWEPYPTSLRIVNWIKWALAREPAALDREALDSLAVQVRWLRARLEVHLLGNHLWANAKALAFAGAFFDGPEAARWRRQGLTLLDREIGEQILPDGGHFELSPMYQAIVIEDLLDLLNLSHVFPGAIPAHLAVRLRDTATRMLRWQRVMTHPDGEIAFFNDAAFGIAAPRAALAEYASRVGITDDPAPLQPIEPLRESGYVRLEAGGAVLICDAAPIGPDHLPGHAHADTLSFELSLDGHRVLVNGGTSTYQSGEARQHQRGTAAHNTVVVDGEDSSETWGAFRVARRARPFGVAWRQEAGALSLEASHDGYRRLPGRVTHHRRWTLTARGLTVDDRLDGRVRSARAFLHLHPDVRPDRLEIVFYGAADASRQPSVWHPEFGRGLDSIAVTAEFAGDRLATQVRW